MVAQRGVQVHQRRRGVRAALLAHAAHRGGGAVERLMELAHAHEERMEAEAARNFGDAAFVPKQALTLKDINDKSERTEARHNMVVGLLSQCSEEDAAEASSAVVSLRTWCTSVSMMRLASKAMRKGADLA